MHGVMRMGKCKVQLDFRGPTGPVVQRMLLEFFLSIEYMETYLVLYYEVYGIKGNNTSDQEQR